MEALATKIKPEQDSTNEDAIEPLPPGRGIFISYRRKDSSGYVRALLDPLNRRFGRDRVFMDMDTVEAGDNFKDLIEEAVGNCGVMVAVIGSSWSTSTDDEGRRRLDNPSDYVRLEITAALERQIPILPVLVNGAKMPVAETLPNDLAPISDIQGLELTDAQWEATIETLISSVSEVIQDTSSSEQPIARIGRLSWQWRGILNGDPSLAAKLAREALGALGEDQIEHEGSNVMVVKKGIPGAVVFVIRIEWQDKGRRQCLVLVSARAAGTLSDTPIFSPFVKRYLRVAVDSLRQSGYLVG